MASVFCAWHQRSRIGLAIVLAMVLSTSVGCGQSAGKLLYVLGVGRGQKVHAQFKLPEGTVLVFVDDPHALLTWPETGDRLARLTSEALIKHKATDAVISDRSVDSLRRADSEFASRAADEIGRKLDADTVIWMQVKEFFAPKDVQDTEAAATLSVSIKVLNANAKKRGDVRLWPADPEGHIETMQLRATQFSRLDDRRDAAADKLAERLSRQIARLFYTHTLGELEDDRD